MAHEIPDAASVKLFSFAEYLRRFWLQDVQYRKSRPNVTWRRSAVRPSARPRAVWWVAFSARGAAVRCIAWLGLVAECISSAKARNKSALCHGPNDAERGHSSRKACLRSE